MRRRSWLEKSSPIVERLLDYNNEEGCERRDRTRIPARESASVSGVHSRVTCNATITDVSTRGMRLIVKKEFPMGSTVIVEWGRGFVPCTVRYLRPTEEGWVIGVEAECLPGVIRLMSELMRSVYDRNRALIALPARISA